MCRFCKTNTQKEGSGLCPACIERLEAFYGDAEMLEEKGTNATKQEIDDMADEYYSFAYPASQMRTPDNDEIQF